MSIDISKAKARISGFTTSLNNKISGAENLIDCVETVGFKSETVRDQLNQRLAEVQESWLKLKAVLDDVVDYYIDNPSEDVANSKGVKASKHYEDYRSDKSIQYDACRNKIIITITKLEPASVAQAQVSVADDDDDEAAVTVVRPPKAVADLKPQKLQKNIQPAQFESWKKALETYWVASRFHTVSPLEQFGYIRNLVDEGLLSTIELQIGAATPVFPNASTPEAGSVIALLEQECLLTHPLVSRRFELLRMTHSPQNTLTEFISQLKVASLNAKFSDVNSNDFIAFYALAMCRDAYQEVRQEALKLEPSEFNLDKLQKMARVYESAQSAMKDMSKATTNYTGGGGGRSNSNDERLKLVNFQGRSQPKFIVDWYDLCMQRKQCFKCLGPRSNCTNSSGQEGCSRVQPESSCPYCSALHLEIACPAKNFGLPPGKYGGDNGGGNSYGFRGYGRGRGRGRRSDYKKRGGGAAGGGNAGGGRGGGAGAAGGARARATTNDGGEYRTDDSDDPGAARCQMTYTNLNDDSGDSDADDPPVILMPNPAPEAPPLPQQPRCTVRPPKDSLIAKCRNFIVNSAASARSFMTKAALPARTSTNAYGAPLRTPAAQWLSSRISGRHGSIPTPKIKLEFFQHGGNSNTAFQAKATPDTGSSQSLFGHNFVEKYALSIDDSAKARAQTLYNASGDLMPLLGVIDIQVKYGDKMCFIDGLVTESYLASPLISWHDLALLGICVLPEGNALCNLCTSSSD